MAVTANVLLEEDSDMETSNYDGDEEALVDGYDPSSTPPFASSSSTSLSASAGNQEMHLSNLQKIIISSSSGDFPLRTESLVLLEQASKYMADLRKQKKISNTKSSMVAPLYKQLESLRNLIPNSSRVGESSCVITDALGYLAQLKRQIQRLEEGMKLTSNAFSRPPQDGASPCRIMVEVVCLQRWLRIQLCCEKREGLMADLMFSLETLGLVFDHVNVSYHNCLVFEALTTQEDVDAIGEEAVRQAIIRTIFVN